MLVDGLAGRNYLFREATVVNQRIKSIFDDMLGTLILIKEKPVIDTWSYVCHFEALHTCVRSEWFMYQLAHHYMGSHNVITLRIWTPAQRTNHKAEEESSRPSSLLLLRLPWPREDRNRVQLLESTHRTLACLPSLSRLLVRKYALPERIGTCLAGY